MSNQFQSTEQLSQSIALAEQRIKEYTKQIEALGNTYAENIIHRELCEAIDNAEAHIAEMKWYLESPEHADNTVESAESSACTRNTNTHQSNEETNMNVHNSVDIEDLDEYKELIQAVEDLETEIESIQEQIDELQV